ncbi:MAG: hypothetical protein LDL33_02875 [Desulfomonile sp.]|nr:hypothetical protein [Desulfomonile sp.]
MTTATALDPHGPAEGAGQPGRLPAGLSAAQWLIVGIAGVILVLGIGWEVPSERRMDALLGRGQLSERQKELLVSLREAYYEKVDTETAEIARKLYRGEPVDFKSFAAVKDRSIHGPVFSEDERIAGFRSFVLHTAAMDEGKAYQALARMRPADWDFDPKFYSYGGTYIYPIGVTIFLFKQAGLIHVTKDFSYYVEHPHHVARMYMIGRGFNIIAFLGTLILIGLLGNAIRDRTTGDLGMLTYALSTLPLGQTLVSKPHVFAAFWVMLSIFSAVRFLERRSWGLLVLSAVAAGVIVLFTLLIDSRSVSASLGRIIIIGGVIGLVFLLSNPYSLISYDLFYVNLKIVGNPDGWNYYNLSPVNWLAFAQELLFRSYSFPAVAFALAGLIAALIWGNSVTIRLAGGLLVLLLLVGMSPTYSRITVFVGPLVCLFAGYGLSVTAARLFAGRSVLRKAFLIAMFMPGALFAGLFARDVIFDGAWYAPTVKWIVEARIGPGTSIGTFGLPDPNFTIPFPFLDTKLVNLYKYADKANAPDYVVLGNAVGFDDEALWARHPLRGSYELAHELGYRPSYDWFREWRTLDEARVSGWVYKRKGL